MRVDDAQQVADERQTWQREHQDSVSQEYPAVGNPARFDPSSWNRHAEPGCFAQDTRAPSVLRLDAGTLQSLVEHQLLICALQNEAPARFMSTAFRPFPWSPRFQRAVRQDVFLVPHLIKSWEENHNQVITFEAGNGDQFAGSALARELTRWAPVTSSRMEPTMPTGS